MLLRASGQKEHKDYNLNAVTDDHADAGVEHSAWLRSLTEAAIGGEWVKLKELRNQAAAAMGEQQVVDTLTVAAAFNGITRVADATGIPLDDNTAEHTVAMRDATGIELFAYAAKSTRYG